MSNVAEYERRIIQGIPFFVRRGASKTELIPIYSWTTEPVQLGTYEPPGDAGTGGAGKLTLDIPPAIHERLTAWRKAQAPRSRAQLRVGR